MENQTAVKKQLTDKRVEEEQIKRDAGKLGDETEVIMPDPEDIEVMYCGKMCNFLIKTRVASENIVSSWLRQYKDMDESSKNQLLDLQNEYEKSFENFKNKVTKIVSQHPLYQRFASVRGFTPYMLSMIMALTKDIARFPTPSKYMIYAGQGMIEDPATGRDIPVTKANINRIKQIYQAQGREFKGFNTVLSGRMHVAAESVLKQRGYFYDLYQKIVKRLVHRVITEGDYEVVEIKKAESQSSFEYSIKHKPIVDMLRKKGFEVKDIKGLKGEKKYLVKDVVVLMKDKKNQSIKIFAHTGGLRRISRTLLHLIYTEWYKLKGLEPRNPYPIEYLGHKHLIKLEDVVAFDEAVTKSLKKEKK